MIEALWDFFGLYKAGSDYLPGFWLTMLLLYLNAGLYLADLYHLVKRKSKAETVSLMAIPGIFAILLVAVASFFTHVPNLLRETSRAKCLSLLITTMLPETNLALLLVVFLYPVLWGIGFWRQRKHEHGSCKRWALSSIPDYIAWIILVCGIGYHLIFGENILHSVLENAKDGDLLALYGSSHGIGLYIWMYGTYILVCKEVVLLVGLLSELLLMRIPLRYRSGKNAVTFVGFYYLFCQNAVFRGTFLIEAALVIPLCGVMLREAASPFSDNASIMLYAAFLLLTGAVFVVLIVVIHPIMRTLSCFDAWGQRKQIRELFCTEYFLMQPVLGTDCSRSLIILSLMNRTQPVCTIFRFSQTSADGLIRKIRMEDGKGSPLQMAGRLRCRSRRQRRQRKCFLMRQTGSVLRRKPEEIGAI